MKSMEFVFAVVLLASMIGAEEQPHAGKALGHDAYEIWNRIDEKAVSDDRHRHHAPATARSNIKFSFYVSRGYLLWMKEGVPALRKGKTLGLESAAPIQSDPGSWHGAREASEI